MHDELLEAICEYLAGYKKLDLIHGFQLGLYVTMQHPEWARHVYDKSKQEFSFEGIQEDFVALVDEFVERFPLEVLVQE